MSLELLNRGKEVGCLSAWQVSQLTLGLLVGDAAGHAETCSLCAQRLDTERKEFQAASYERVPASLLNRGAQSRWFISLRPGRWTLIIAGVALLLIGILAWVGGRALQGKPWLLASVQRQGSEVVQAAPADQLGKLMAGDQLRLQVAPKTGLWTRVQVRRGERWETFFEGVIPEDGWLPAGLTVETLGKTQVRLWNCARIVPEGISPSGKGCKFKELNL